MISRLILRLLPKSPGAYIIKDAEGVPLYISWAKDIKGACLAHSKAIGTPREKAIALAFLAHYVEAFEGAEEDRVERMIKRAPPQFNRDFDPNKAERLTLIIPPQLEQKMRVFARVRYVRARKKGSMLAPTPGEYLRFLVENDLNSGYAAIDRRRSEVD